MVAVHAVKMTIPTQGSRMSFVHQARLAHSLRTARGGGRKGRTRQHGRGRKRAKGRERARSRRGGRRAHARAQAVRARGGHKRREHAILSGLTLRAGHVTRADGGGVRDPPPVKRRPRPAARCCGFMVVKSFITSPATVPPSIRPCSPQTVGSTDPAMATPVLCKGPSKSGKSKTTRDTPYSPGAVTAPPGLFPHTGPLVQLPWSGPNRTVACSPSDSFYGHPSTSVSSPNPSRGAGLLPSAT